MLLSFCLIVNDTIDNVRRLIENVRGVCDEIVIVDGGSAPEVCQYEEQVANKFFHHRWEDDFAKMRNFAISKSSGDWILALDSDETLSEPLKRKIPELIKNNHVDGYKFHRVHYCDENPPLPDYWTQLRLYKQEAVYVGAVHESIKNLKNIEVVEDKDCLIMHHNHRDLQREKSLQYSKSLQDKIEEAKKNHDEHSLEYYQYKLWIQDNVYLLETDPNTDYNLLKSRYAEYEQKKAAIEEKIKREGWEIK